MSVKDKIRLTARGYRMIHTLVPGYLTVMGIDALLSSILPFINIFMSARIITALAAQKSLEQVFRLALITAALNVLTALLSSALQRLSAYSNAKFYQFFEKPLTDKVAQMDYERVEDTEVHLKKESIMLLRRTSGWGLSRLIWCYTGTLSGILTMVFSISLLGGAFSTRHTIDAGAWDFIFFPAAIFVVLLLITVNLAVGIFLTKISSKKEADWMIDLTQTNRLGSYYFNNLLSYKAGKDLKLYALKAPMLAEFSEIMAQYSKPMRVLFKMTAKYHSLIAASNTVMTGIIYAYVTLKALFGSFGVGSIVQYVGSLARLNDGVSTVMWNLTMLNSNIEPLKLFFEFIDMPDKKHQGTLPVEKRNDNDYEIEFCGVSFKYPGTEVYALRDFNLKLAIGQRLAVVGMNGSGKTTMIKLLCRLYDPTEGEIKLNGIDIKKYDYNEYLSLFGVVFQDFRLFAFSLGQNVATSVDYDADKAADTLKKAGFADRLSSMPKKLETPLYKEFDEDGVEISGGEAQKIALARALYKNAPFIVLDEPTAALDPLAEYEIYSTFNEIVGEKTAVYISHRLSSCRFCDDIAVFHEGKLIQRGSHENLIADETGKYYELWNAQAQYYTN